MANLKEESKWEEGVYQFETSDPVQGGPDGIDNVPTKQLANRTRHLKDRADGNDKRVGEVSTKVDALGKRTDELGNEKLPYTGGTLKGVLRGKVGAITPNNTNNAGFGFDNDPDTGMFSPSDGYLQIGAQGVSHLEIQGNNCFVGPAAANGWLALIAGGAERMRITREGRVLLGTTADSGREGFQVAYRTSFANGVRSSGMDLDDTLGGQYRATSANYGVMLRNDDRDCYLLQTKKGDPLGPWNDYRPILWNLESGFLRLDDTGRGTSIGGSVEMRGDLTLKPSWGEGRLRFGATDGYFYANADNVGWYSATKGSFQYFYSNRTFRIDGATVYHMGNLAPLDLNNGGTLTLFYLDPPYYETEGYGVAFPFAEYEKLAQRLRSIKGRAIVSLNDHPDIRRVFDGFHIETVPIQYTVGGGRGVERNELIIFSWDDAAQPVGLF